MSRPIPYLALVCWIGLTLSGCSKKAAPTEHAAGEPSAAVSPAMLQPPAVPALPATPLRIGYSDWPGWVAWEIAIQKGWFKEAGVNVEFKWFEYIPSMEAFSAGRIDAVTMTNGDALVTGSSGAPSVCIVANDYSNGNDMVVAKPGIKGVAELKGKRVGVEKGFVDHLLLLRALDSVGLNEKDIKLIDLKTDETPQSLKSGSVDAIAAWQPNSGAALKEVPGATPIFTSANVPGLIYDHLCVNPKSLAAERPAWEKIVRTWMRIADYLADEKNLDEASKIMGARVGLAAAEYRTLMRGTYFLGKEGNLKHFKPGEGLESILGSSKFVDAFNVKNGVYKTAQNVATYFDASLVEAVAK